MSLSGAPASIARYEVWEATMTENGAYTNPWDDVVITAVFTAPSGKTYNVGGFYYDTKTWKLRFAPMETGTWSWNLTFDNGSGTDTKSGNFTCTASGNTGFLRSHPQNGIRFITEGDNQPYYANGFNIAVGGGAKLPLNGQIDDSGISLPMTDVLRIYRAAGINTVRDNAQGISHITAFNIGSTGKNTYKIAEGKIDDEWAQDLHNAGMKFQFGLLFRPTTAPFTGYDVSNAQVKLAYQNYHRYIINRYGAYVDIWEVANEVTVTQDYLTMVGAACQQFDPYHHFLTISYILNNPPPPPADQSMLTVAGNHLYSSTATPGLDRQYQKFIVTQKTGYPGRPILLGEAGNSRPFGQYDPERYRIDIWTAFSNEAGMLFWLQVPKGNYNGTGLANQYIGSEERSVARILANFNAGFDPLAVPKTVTLSSSAMRGYVLGGASDVAGYFIHTTNPHAPLSATTVTLTVPASGLQGTWMDPATGQTLQTFSPASGSQKLTIPTFACDIALRIAPAPTTPRLEFETASYSIGENQGSVSLKVKRAGPTTGAVSVSFSTVDGRAVAGTGYTSTSGTLNWAAGDASSKTVTVPVLNNNLAEGDKDFQLALSNPTGGAVLGGNASAMVTVFEDDACAPVFNASATTVLKTAGAVNVTVNRRGTDTGAISISYYTYASTTAAASITADYVPVVSPATLSWGAGDFAPKTFAITIKNNSALTSTKFFNLNLDTPVSTGVSSRSGYERSAVAIVPNATQPGLLQFSGASFLKNMVGNSGYVDRGYAVTRTAGSIAVPVSRTGGSTGIASVTYALQGGTAVAGTDYTAVTGTLTWADGDAADKTITVPVINSATVGNVMTWLTLSSAKTAVLPFSGNLDRLNSVGILMTDPNLPPVITSAQFLGAQEGTPVTYTVKGTSNPTSFSATNLPSGLSINGSTGVITGTPAVGSARAYNVTLTATNASGTGTDQFVLVVAGTAQTPVISASPASIGVIPGQTATFSVTATGTAPFTYQWKKNGTAISGATASSYTTPATVAGDNNAQFSVVVTNGQGSATSSNAILTVTASAAAPAIVTQPASQSLQPGQSVTFSVSAAGTSPFTYQWRRNGSAVSGEKSASLSLSPVTSADNGAAYSVVVTNSAGSATSANAVLTVGSSVPPPVAGSDTATTPANTAATINVLANDTASNGYTLSVTSVGLPAHGTAVKNANNTITYTPAANYSGSDVFTYTISDGHGGTASTTCSVTITAVVTPPTADDDSATTPANTAAIISVLANDSASNGYTLSVTTVGSPSHGSAVKNANNTVTYTPAANYVGGDSFTYSISDGHGGTASASCSITVTAVVTPPQAGNDSASTQVNTPVTVPVLANDTASNGYTLSVTSVGPAAHGTAVKNADNTVTYTPAASYVGGDSFTYSISDGHGGTASATCSITVTGGGGGGGSGTSGSVSLTGWALDQGSTATGLGTQNPTLGNGTAGTAANTALSVSFPAVTLANAGDTVSITGSAAITLTSAAPDQFSLGLYNHNAQAGLAGWLGYSGSNSNGGSAGAMRERTNPNSVSYFTSGGASVLKNSIAAGSPSFSSGTYALLLKLTKNSAGGVQVDFALGNGGSYVLADSYTDNGNPNTTSTYDRVGIFTGASFNASSIKFSNLQVNTPLPAPWQSQDIGAAGVKGTTSYTGGAFTVNGCGTIAGNADICQFVYQPMNGDCTVTARMASQTTPAGAARSGVMIRESLATGAKTAEVILSPTDKEFYWRATDNATASVKYGTAGGAPYWLRMTRVGNGFSAYTSADGVAWSQLGTTQTIPMATTVYVGMMCNSHSTTVSNTAVYDNVTVTP